LILSSRTIAVGSFEERVRAAADTGCAGLGLRWQIYEEAAAPAGELRAMLEEHGVAAAEYEVLGHWALADELPDRARDAEDRIWRMADALGGKHVIAVVFEEPGPREATAERLSALADRAAAHGLVVALEFLPWSPVADAEAAWELVQLAGNANAGVLVDSWHFYRGAADEAHVRAIPPERIVALHLDDADAEVVGTLSEDTWKRRRVPGEGAFPLVDFIRMLDEIGVTAPYGVEVLSDELAELPPGEAARRAVSASRTVMAAARATSRD
jgi:sugar phosphate isomerase/epimerase